MVWERRKLIIWGETFPELSTKYTETVCTGAFFADADECSYSMVRLYPLTLRDLPDNKRPRKWDIISANIMRSPTDPRPESYRIDVNSIQRLGHIDTSDGWEGRYKYLIKDAHMVSGLEDMERRQAETRQSFGVAKPTDLSLRLVPMTEEESEQWQNKYELIRSQQDLFGSNVRPLTPPVDRVRATFRCEGDEKEYDRLLTDWEFLELARRHPHDTAAFESTIRARITAGGKEPLLIFGNIANYQHTFIIVGLVYGNRVRQTSLF